MPAPSMLHAIHAGSDSTGFREFQTRFLYGLLVFDVVLALVFLLLHALGGLWLHPGQMYFVAVIAVLFATLAGVVKRYQQAYVPVALVLCVMSFALFVQALLLAQVNELRVLWFLMAVGAGYLLLGRLAGLLMALATLAVVWSTNSLHVTPYTRQALLIYSAVLVVMCYGYHYFITYALGLYQRLAEREALFRLLTEDSAEVVWRVNREHVLTYISPADERLRGFAAQEVVGRPVHEMFTDEGVHILRDALRRDLTLFVAPVRCRDGSERWFEVSSQPERDAEGSLVGYHGMGRDVTERLRLQAELEQHRTNLEGLVRERTADLSVAKDAAEAASRAKNIFLANISHELRTPMTLIMGLSELVRARLTEPRNQELLDQVLVQSRKLTALITDLIDYAALGAKRMDLRQEPLHLAPLLGQVQALLGEAAAAKGLSLVVEMAPGLAQTPLLGDAQRLQQVLMQLTDNAIKFTREGQVTLRVREPTPVGSDKVLLRVDVQDTGIGIDPRDQWRVFNAFEQADGTATRQHEGTGLGLALCKRLVEAMDGRIGVTSQPGQGSTFHFSVVLGQPSGYPGAAG